MQKICIRNNGPVKAFEMEIEKFNLLIGEQATGKSTIAKSVYFFRNIKTKVISYLSQIYDTRSYDNIPQESIRFDKEIKTELKDVFIKLFGYSWDLNPEFYMKYDYADEIWIKTELRKGSKSKRYISVTYSPRLMNEIKKLQEKVTELHQDYIRTMSSSFALANEEAKRNRNMIKRKVCEIFCDDEETYYIPAGRALLTVLSESRASMNSMVNLDLITETFMTLIDMVRPRFKQGVKKAHLQYPLEKRKFDVNVISDFIINIEKGEYFFNGGREFLKIKEDPEHPVSINFASSGQQEILWLLNFVYILMLNQEKAFVIIEEPETHIYPLLQKKLMEFITIFANVQESRVFITTHSPYILNVMNNLYYAGILADEGKEKQVYEVLKKNVVIQKRKLSAYKLLNFQESSGEKNSINLLDDEGREIRAGLIDDVSSQINEDYTALYDIELEDE